MVEDIIVERQVDDPMLTPAQLEHLRSGRLHKLEGGWVPGRGDTPPGKILANVKLTTLVGGLARIRDRTDAQVLAAARYRGLYDRIQIGGARAIDYTAVRVDTSAGPVDLVLSMGDEARQEYRRAVRRLGMTGSVLVEDIVCHDRSLRDLARRSEGGDGGAARQRVVAALLAQIDELVDLFGYGAAHARSRVAMRASGETLPIAMRGQILVPRRRQAD
jgi:hypothetical protein